MNIVTVISVIIFIAIVSFPFVMAYRNKRKKEKMLLAELLALANRQFSVLEEKEINGNIVLALDKEKTKLFYVHLDNSGVRSKVLLLEEFHNSHVRSRYVNDDSNGVIDTINLIFDPSGGRTKNVSLEIYNYSNTTFLDDELRFARKWSDRLNTICFTKNRVTQPLEA